MIPMVLALVALGADTPCVSGPRVGQRPGPYSFVMSTGPERGKPHCYICETADRPAVIIFARTASPALGKLASRLDEALATHKAAELRSWITILADDHSKVDASLLAWAKKHAVRSVPVGVFEDVEGPPAYRLHKDADVTVLLSVKQKVVANHAFRAGELDDARIAAILGDLTRIVPKKK
jgi:hypothetical protein